MMRYSYALVVLPLIALAMTGGLRIASSPLAHEIRVIIDRSILADTAQPPNAIQGRIAAFLPDHGDASQSATAQDSESATSVALAPVPDPRLIESSATGFLPRKAENGDRPAILYARPVKRGLAASYRARLAFVMIHAGISETDTRDAAAALPPDVTFSLSPYVHDGERLIRDIRDHGHEVFLDIASVAAPDRREDRGPYALDPTKDRMSNRDHLYRMMSRFTGYAGLVAELESGLADAPSLHVLLDEEAEARGLYLLDFKAAAPHDMQEIHVLDAAEQASFATALDAVLTRLAPDKALVLIAPLDALKTDAIKDWLALHQAREFDLVPLTALMRETERM